MIAGPGSRPSAEDLKIEEQIKNSGYEYPVSFPVFWKSVREKLSERGAKNANPLFLFIPKSSWTAAAYSIGAAAVLVIAFIFIMNLRPSALVTMTRGYGEVRTAGSGNWRPITVSERIPGGMEVRTVGSGEMEMQIDGQSRIRLNGDTSVTLQEIGPVFGNGQTVVKLDQGSMNVQARFEKQEAKFVVLSSLLKITSGKNRLTVTRTSENETRISALDAPVVLEPAFKKTVSPMNQVRMEAGDLAVVSGKNLSDLSAAETNIGLPDLRKKYRSAFRVRTMTRTEVSEASKNTGSWLSTGGQLVKTSFVSDPGNARVVLNGRDIGLTPLTSLQEKNSPLEVIVMKDGFKVYSTNIKPTNDSVLSFPLGRENGPGDTAELSPFPERLEWFANLPAGVLEKPCAFNEGYVYCADGNAIKTFYNRKLVKSIAVSREKISLTGPVYRNGKVYIASDQGALYSYNPVSDEISVLKEGGRNLNTRKPVASGNRIIMVTGENGVEIFGQDGKLENAVLQHETGGVRYEPYYSGKKEFLVLSAADGRLIAYDVKKNRTAWTFKNAPGKMGGPLAGNDQTVFVYSGWSGTVSAFRLSDGKLLWKWSNPEIAGAEVSLTADIEQLYVTSVSGRKTGFVVLNVLNGNQEFRNDFPGVLLAPVLMEGKAVLISKSGKTALYEPSIREIEYNSILN